MSADDEFGFAAPAFNAEQALQQLQRELRALKLTARGTGFELRGKPVAELRLEGSAIAARMARKLAMTPEWDRKTLADAGAQRQWLNDLKQRLQRWERED